MGPGGPAALLHLHLLLLLRDQGPGTRQLRWEERRRSRRNITTLTIPRYPPPPGPQQGQASLLLGGEGLLLLLCQFPLSGHLVPPHALLVLGAVHMPGLVLEDVELAHGWEGCFGLGVWDLVGKGQGRREVTSSMPRPRGAWD
jgi:hypothetical protein